MPADNAAHQRAYRARQQEKLARSTRMEAALRAIVAQLGDTKKPAAIKIRDLALAALPAEDETERKAS